jgi:heme exporter protein C
MNATGMIFAHGTWQTWWTPSLRLISSAMLWFLYAAYVILRSALTAEQRREQLCAVFGIIAFVDVPLVFISARFVRDIHRPSVTFESPWQTLAFGLAVLGALLLAAALIRLRADIASAESRIDSAAASGAD